MGQSFRRMEDLKSLLAVARNQDCAKETGLN